MQRSFGASLLVSGLVLGLVLGLLAGLGCGSAEAPLRVLRIESIRPTEGSTGVLLNEELILTFTAPVDPSSVTGESLSVLSDAGDAARGRWEVRGRQVRFHPAPVRSRELTDGGYRPGTRYRVLAAGFPRVDGIRSAAGEPLVGSVAWTFETASAEGRAPLFSDESPDVGQAVSLSLTRSSAAFERGAPLVLFSQEPLDPTTLSDEDFVIVRKQGPHTPIAVRGSFARNDPESSKGEFEASAEIELMPVTKLEPRKEYYLLGAGDAGTSGQVGLRDFGGNRVWRRRSLVDREDFRVTEPSGAGFERGSELLVSFLEADKPRFSPVAVPWADGTAHWTSAGAVRVRFPAAAGTGVLGDVELGADEARADVEAVRIAQVTTRKTRLTSGPGLCVLRTQGRLSIAGTLERRSAGRNQPMTFRPGETLSVWLERARSADKDWTVLIAGGDLVIEGTIDVDTPLLLVAGGWIRIDGDVQSRCDSQKVPRPIYLLGDGGGINLDPLTGIAPLVMDPPVDNPLNAELRFAAISTPIPSGARPVHWLRAASGGQTGSGQYQVRFLPYEGEPREADTVIHPQLLGEPGPIRLVIELSLGPADSDAATWDPPFVDFVDLSWE